MGVRSLAVSLETDIVHHHITSDQVDFSTAAHFSASFARRMLHKKFSEDIHVIKSGHPLLRHTGHPLADHPPIPDDLLHRHPPNAHHLGPAGTHRLCAQLRSAEGTAWHGCLRPVRATPGVSHPN